jgi:CHAT domain-containing protein
MCFEDVYALLFRKVSFCHEILTFFFVRVERKYIFGLQNMLKFRHILLNSFLLLFLVYSAYTQKTATIDSFDHYYNQKKYIQALNYLNGVDDDELSYEILKKKGNCYHFTGNLDSSLYVYLEAYNTLLPNDTIKKIDISINIANAWQGLFQTDSAYKYLSFVKKNLQVLDNHHIAKTFISIGNFYNDTHILDSAEFYLLKALHVSKQIEKDTNELLYYCYENLTQLYIDMDEFSKAEYYGRIGFEYISANDISNSWWRFIFCYDLGRVHYANRNWGKTIYYFNKALSCITKELKSYDQYIRNVLSYCYGKVGEIPLAENFYSSNETFVIDTMAYSYHLDCYGNFLENQARNYPEALDKYWQGLFLNQAKYSKYHLEVVHDYWVIGRTYHKYRKYDSSLYYFQRALYCNSKDVDTLDYATNPVDVFNADRRLTEIIGRKLASLIAIKQQPLSRDSLQSINRLIVANCDYYGHCVEARLHNKTFMQDRLAVLKREIRKYMLAGMDAAHALYQDHHDSYYLEKALQFSETGKYLLVKSMMSSRNQNAKLPDTLSRLNISLVNRINSLHMEIKKNEAAGKTMQTALLKDQLFNLILQKDSVRSIILQQYPETTGRQFQLLSFDKIKSGIKEGQMLINYFLEDTVLHIVQLTSDSVFWLRNENAARVREMAGQVVPFCNPRVSDPSDKAAYIDHAIALKQLLLGNPPKLRGIEEFILVPDRELNLLPFEALLSKKPNPGTPYRELPYLLYDFTFSYHHSLYLAGERNEPQKPRGQNKFIAVAPDFKGDASQVRDGLSSIVEAGGEAAYLAELFKGELLSGRNATKTHLEPYLQQASVVHFATHTRTDTTGMFNTGLMLAGDTAENIYEPFLTSEICCSDMQADLVMLSACSSGNGLILDGEGVISLGWAFRYAGCKSVGISLFPLDDASARTIMTSFYTGLRDGLSKNHSLRAAKIEFLETVVPGKTHPKYWAGLTVVGDQSAIASPSNHTVQLIVTLILAVLFTLLVIIAVRKRKARNLEVS